MKLGFSNIEAIYLGTLPLDKVYAGFDTVFELGNKWKQPAYSNWTYTTGYNWDTSRYNTITCNSYASGAYPNQIFEDSNAAWQITQSLPVWIGFYTEPIKINSVLLNCPWGSEYVATAFEIQGSNDGSSWTTLGSYTRDSSNLFGIVRYTIPNANRNYYQYHRIYVTSGSTGTGVSFGELSIDADLQTNSSPIHLVDEHTVQLNAGTYYIFDVEGESGSSVTFAQDMLFDTLANNNFLTSAIEQGTWTGDFYLLTNAFDNGDYVIADYVIAEMFAVDTSKPIFNATLTLISEDTGEIQISNLTPYSSS